MPLQIIPLPDAVFRLLQGRSTVLTKSYSVDAGRWQRELAARNLALPHGPLGTAQGWVKLSRADVLPLADAAPTRQAAMNLLWYALAWGLGGRAPRLTARLERVC